MSNAYAYDNNVHTAYAKQPVHIKCGSFRCTLHSADKFLEIPVDKIPLLWAPMFKAADENESSIELIENWLLEEESKIKDHIEFLKNELKLQTVKTEEARRTVTVFGSAVRKEHKQAHQNAVRQEKKLADAIKSAKNSLNKVAIRKTLFYKMS